MPKKEIERNLDETKDDQKPKYDPMADFFDSLTNSTLEKRGGRGFGGGLNRSF